MMSGKVIIYLSNNGMVIYRWNRNQLVDDLHLLEPDNVAEQLKNYFNSIGNKPVRLVIDILEEMYSLESIPHLNSRDRLSMIKRKQKQLYPGNRFVYTQYKGRSTAKRKDDLLLFAAITNDRIIKQWLDLLFEIKVKVAGIYSLPVLMESLAKQLKGNNNKLIISISIDKQDILLRQSFYKDNILSLSRFKQIHIFDQQGLAKEIEEDVNRSQRFVSRHFGIAFEKNVSVYFFASGTAGRNIFEQIDFEAIRLKPTLLLTHEYAQSQGDKIPDDCGLPAYVTGLSARSRKQKSHYIDSQSRFYYLHHLINKGLNSASIGLVLFGLIYLFNGYFNSSNMHEQTDKLRAQRIQLIQKLANTPDAPLFKGFNPLELVAQLHTHKKLNKHILSSEKIMDAISQSLDVYPEIILTHLEWGPEQKQQSPSIEMVAASPPYDPTQEEVTGEEISNKPAISITLQAQIERFNGDFRYALNLIEQFRTQLNRHRSIDQITAIKLPVDISNKNELSGTIKQQKNNAQFILEMKWLR